ncbi:perlucin-like [Ylistrum balloti]|uniref:perlucin-like n=1 Tax=Ylistrum balloti TaxID=509963 RepID=UPI002905E61C|nr:perlucin-like [Ylistrum balloti]
MKLCVFFLALCAGLQGSRGACPIDFQQYGESCYKVFFEPVSWIDAKKYCQVFGGDLVKIETQEEEAMLDNVLNDVHTNKSARVENYWIDGSDELFEGEWRWVGTPGYSQIISGYTHWAPNQPDNDDGTENCMQIRFDFNLYWNDEECTDKDSFICEAEYSDGIITGEVIG